jgi:hypothetical protein
MLEYKHGRKLRHLAISTGRSFVAGFQYQLPQDYERRFTYLDVYLIGVAASLTACVIWFVIKSTLKRRKKKNDVSLQKVVVQIHLKRRG